MASPSTSSNRTHGRSTDSPGPATVVFGVVLLLAGILAGCSTQPAEAGPSQAETAVPEPVPSTTSTTARPTTTTTEPPPILAGTPNAPFSPLPESAEATAVITPSGVVLPVVDDRRVETGRDSWLVMTPCSDVRFVSGGTPLGRAHVVLDPGHGGREFGAVGPNGLVEKELNLDVALAAQRMLTEAGATVVLTRSTDIAMTTGVRAALARTVQPALFVSIHHNGGAPANGDQPGTIVFTKSDSAESRRFGGLFNETLAIPLAEIGDAKREEFRLYAEAFVAHEEAVAAYDRSVAGREEALVANGQLDPAVTTTLPEAVDPRSRMDGTEEPSVREPAPTTTTLPVPDDRTTVVVPDTIAPPPVPVLQRVPEFRWAGTGNAGVRSWRGDDGRDLLSVLRRSGDVPAVLAEFLYVTNPVEEALLSDPAFIELEARALADAVIRHLSTTDEGTGFVADQVGDQDIGGGGRVSDCIEPDLGLDSSTD